MKYTYLEIRSRHVNKSLIIVFINIFFELMLASGACSIERFNSVTQQVLLYWVSCCPFKQHSEYHFVLHLLSFIAPNVILLSFTSRLSYR